MNRSISQIIDKEHNQTRIWYPGSFYANQEWINYLSKRYQGAWYFSDTQSNLPEWVGSIPRARCTINLDTLSETALEFQIKLKPDVIIISNHPGLKCLSEVEQWLNQFIHKPQILVCCFIANVSGNYLNENVKGYEMVSELNREGCKVFEFKRG
jgi:hypothetical protein